MLVQAVIPLIQLIRFGSHHFLLCHSPVRSVLLHALACGFFPLFLSFLAVKKVPDQIPLKEQTFFFQTLLQYKRKRCIGRKKELHILWMTTHIPLMKVLGWCALKDGSSFFACSALRLIVRLLSWTQYNNPTRPPKKISSF